MNQELRERAILPVLIPVVAIVLTEIVVFSMSRVLLATGKTAAVVIALGAAVAILVGASALAAGRRVRTSTIVGVLVLMGIVTVAAGALALQSGSSFEREAAANLPRLEVSAANLTFDTDTLELSPQGATINFENTDSQPHNIAIYPSADELTNPLFKGDIINAGQSTTYEVEPIEPGVYYFHCDVHPTMNGEAVVEQGAGSAEHEAAH